MDDQFNKEPEKGTASTDNNELPAATKSQAIQVPRLELPKGGGALKGVDEKFSVNAANGTAAFQVPLSFSPGRNGFTPSLALSYDSGTGNSLLGVGWSMEVPSIQRKTDKQLPAYTEEDVFLLAGTEDLVPVLSWNNVAGEWESSDTTTGDFHIRYFRPRIEGAFARIEKISHPVYGTYWRVCQPDNTTTFYGFHKEARIYDPVDEKRIFRWLPEISFDDKGNCIVYEYKKENAELVANELHEKNRLNGTSLFLNQYLKRIRHGNRVPYYVDPADPYTLKPAAGDFVFETVFDYGEHDTAFPLPEEIPTLKWAARPDAFSSYRSGFEIRTYRLLQRVLFYHRFDELHAGAATLVRSLDLTYSSSSEDAAQPTELSTLEAITQCGYILKPDQTYSRKTLPPVEFSYEKLNWSSEIRTPPAEAMENLPSGLSSGYQWIDLFGEGIPGVFTEQGESWFFKPNLGDTGETGTVKFGSLKKVSPKPSFTGFGNGTLQLQDIEADGRKQIVFSSGQLTGFFELSGEEEWMPLQVFETKLNIDLKDPNLRMLDLDGDGRPDLLVTENEVFTFYASKGKAGYGEARKTTKGHDEEKGPAIAFSDPAQSIYLADMSGDGLTDIVRIRNGEICYWPNLGYGKFGAKVTMGNAPCFDHPDRFNPGYLQLADVSGTGATDILYLGEDRCCAYINLAGNRWSDARVITQAFRTARPSAVTVADLNGNGTACLVWSSELPEHVNQPLRYIDLMGGKKPHLLIRHINNTGKETALEYKSSTWFYLKDKAEQKPWITKLPFPVYCVRKVTVRDRVTGSAFTSSYRFHHGHYDYAEREFRGFGMVEQVDTEQYEHWVKSGASNIVPAELHQPPVLTKTWYHTGAYLEKEKILTHFRGEYWDAEMTRQGFPETAEEAGLPDAQLAAAPGLPASLLQSLSTQEWREASRACKGMVLRQETFALDAPATGATADQLKRQLSPYSVATHNCHIELLQQKAGNTHAVFIVKESEAITYQYERNLHDPRIAHSLNIRFDELGNVLEAASVTYPRKQTDPDVPADIRLIQQRTLIVYTETAYTNDVKTAHRYRLRKSWETKTWELKGVTKAGELYTPEHFTGILTTAVPLEYRQYDGVPAPGTVSKRLIEQVCSLFYKNDLSGALAPGVLESTAIPYESYQKAYTPDLLQFIFAGRVGQALMTEAKFIHFGGDADWWVRSGTAQYLGAGETEADARNRFYSPLTYTEPYGAKTTISYLGSYYMFIGSVEDELLNKSVVETFNYRLLGPQRIKDPNDNISETISDELGVVKASASFGKGAEADDLTGFTEYATPAEEQLVADYFAAADTVQLTARGKQLLQHATARFVYDIHRYRNSNGQSPVVTGAIIREQHYQGNNDSPVQLSFEYSNGTGGVVMKKGQCEPGPAKSVTVDIGNSITVTETDTALLVPPRLRWLGNGRTVMNNKGKPVKQYEPYFSLTHEYENYKELVETGVTSIIYYDPSGRPIRTEAPNGTFGKTEFSSWKKINFDPNDNLLESAWYSDRIGNLIDAELLAEGKDPVKEKQAAEQTETHANTPATEHFDTLGRAVLTVEHNGKDAADNPLLITTRNETDIEGNSKSVTDARGNTVMRYRHDMLGHPVYTESMDAGRRWTFKNILDKPVRTWDERNLEVQFSYDILHRPTEKRVIGGDGDTPLDHVVEKVIYGEGIPNAAALNFRGRAVSIYDTAGKTTTGEYDFKGNVLQATRTFASAYKEVVKWNVANPDSKLEPQSYPQSTTYDAMNRVVTQHTPDGSIYTPGYNEAGKLDTVQVTQGALTEWFVKKVSYNEKGQRRRIVYGNDVSTNYYYDRKTFGLIRIETKRQNNDPLQDIYYTFDPAGNITHLEDKNIPEVFFNNQKITGTARYAYDPLYRLKEASGREHIAQTGFGLPDNWNDLPFLKEYSPGDPMAWRNYTQKYRYDDAGNISEMKHIAVNGSWTRAFQYEATSNRLNSSSVSDDNSAYAPYLYPHHAAHGFFLSMPHLQVMKWNFSDQLQAVARQQVVNGTPETTYYIYDGAGQRARKITEREAPAGTNPISKKSQRIYLGGIEIFTEYDHADTPVLKRNTYHVMDDKTRIAMIETRTEGIDDGPERLVRYQFSNHIGSASLETDQLAAVISYEEYHPFGTTAYQAVDKNIKAAYKRYRYTGMERDEESGLEYHSARYYVPWLGRWIKADPAGLKDGPNLYRYARNNPVRLNDPNGMDPPRSRFSLGEFRLRLSSDGINDPVAHASNFDAFVPGLFGLGFAGANMGQWTSNVWGARGLRLLEFGASIVGMYGPAVLSHELGHVTHGNRFSGGGYRVDAFAWFSGNSTGPSLLPEQDVIVSAGGPNQQVLNAGATYRRAALNGTFSPQDSAAYILGQLGTPAYFTRSLMKFPNDAAVAAELAPGTGDDPINYSYLRGTAATRRPNTWSREAIATASWITAAPSIAAGIYTLYDFVWRGNRSMEFPSLRFGNGGRITFPHLETLLAPNGTIIGASTMLTPGRGLPTFQLGIDAVATDNPGATISVRTYGLGNSTFQINPYIRGTIAGTPGIFGGAEFRLNLAPFAGIGGFIEGGVNDPRSQPEGRTGPVRGGIESIWNF